MTVPLGEPRQGCSHRYGYASFSMCHINMPFCKHYRKERKVHNKRQSFSGVSMRGKREEHFEISEKRKTGALHEDHDKWQ